MFEWLKGKEFVYNNEGCMITGFDEKENKFTAIAGETERPINVNLNEIVIEHHFGYEDKWYEKLYKKLLESNELNFNFWSTESGDNWFFEIKRTETILNDEITLVNYTVIFAGNIRGNVFSTQLGNENLETFTKWIIDQMEENTLFNSYDCVYQTLEGITMEDSFITEDEISRMYEMMY